MAKSAAPCRGHLNTPAKPSPASSKETVAPHYHSKAAGEQITMGIYTHIAIYVHIYNLYRAQNHHSTSYLVSISHLIAAGSSG